MIIGKKYLYNPLYNLIKLEKYDKILLILKKILLNQNHLMKQFKKRRKRKKRRRKKVVKLKINLLT